MALKNVVQSCATRSCSNLNINDRRSQMTPKNCKHQQAYSTV